MGKEMLDFYTTKVKKEYKIAFIATFFIGLLVHIYKFVNTLPNHDSIYSYYSTQNMIGSGRWGLSLACGFGSYFDLPWINGIISCVLIAATVVMIAALFKIKNPVLIVLTGALLVASPATTETFFFMFTADGYMMAMLLASVAVYLTHVGENSIAKNAAGAVCICIACSIYQAYVSFALLLSVSYFIVVLFENRYSKKECLRWVLRQMIIYSAGLLAYYVTWKVLLQVTGAQVNDYQGISSVGTISISMIVRGMMNAIKTAVLYLVQWNVLEHGWTIYSVLSLCGIGALAAGLAIAFIRSKIYTRVWAVVLLVLCLLAVIPFGCMWHFVSETINYGSRMLQGYTVLWVLTLLLYERWAKSFYKNMICVFMICIIYNNAIMANISYFYMNLSYERTYADGIEMVMRIHELEDTSGFDQVAVLGDRLDAVQWDTNGLDVANTLPSGGIHILSYQLESNLMSNAEHLVPFLNATFGMQLNQADTEELAKIKNTESVKKMKCWPSPQGMTIVDDTLVIKLAE